MEAASIPYLDAILYAIGLVTAMLIFMPFSPMTIDLLMLPRGVQIWIHRNRYKLWTIVGICFGLLLLRALGGMAGGDWLWVTIVTLAMLAFMFWSGYVPFVMTAPRNPKQLEIGEADKLFKPDEVVLGLVEGGEVRAYPRDAIARPHYFTDTVGGTKFFVSYCILCNSGMAFKAELEGRPLDLECVTAYNNNIIYLDSERGNYLQQLDGTVFEGPDQGKALEQHPVVQASWAEWKTLHPDTKLYYAPAATFRDKMVAAMLRMMIPISRLSKRKTPWHRIRGKLDKRLPAMSYVLGVEIGGETCGYPVSALRESPVVNDTVGGEPVVVLYDSGRDIGAVFSRRVDGRELSFKASAGADGVIARDSETGTGWDVTGGARGGELANASLAPVAHYNKLFWFSWALFKPGTRVNPAPA
jgi:hypothetical protein